MDNAAFVTKQLTSSVRIARHAVKTINELVQNQFVLHLYDIVFRCKRLLRVCKSHNLINAIFFNFIEL